MDAAEAKFYKDFYRILNNPEIEQLFVKYAQMKYNSSIKKVLLKHDVYDSGFHSGQALAWQDLIQLKSTVTEIMRNLSV